CVSSRTQCAQRGLDNGSSSLQRSPSFPLRGPLGPCVFPFWMALRALCLSVLDGLFGPCVFPLWMAFGPLSEYCATLRSRIRWGEVAHHPGDIHGAAPR